MKSMCMKGNMITVKIRQAIADEMQMAGLSYSGKLEEPAFLNKIFDLKHLPCSRRESRFDNAYDDIYQHTVLNPGDYPDDWIYTDSRINLLHVDDETYLKFLSQTLHPLVRSDETSIEQLLRIYNTKLNEVDIEMAKVDEQCGKPIYSHIDKSSVKATLGAKKLHIKKYLDTAYVNGKIDLMNSAVNNSTDLAIGTAKDLLETACKSILKQKGIIYERSWDLNRLVRETTNQLDFKPNLADDPAAAERSIEKILRGLVNTLHGVAELRNAYGTGHGKHADFIGLEPMYARLVVGIVAEIVTLLLSVNGEKAELEESV